jgi:hypothetical protein
LTTVALQPTGRTLTPAVDVLHFLHFRLCSPLWPTDSGAAQPATASMRRAAPFPAHNVLCAERFGAKAAESWASSQIIRGRERRCRPGVASRSFAYFEIHGLVKPRKIEFHGLSK